MDCVVSDNGQAPWTCQLCHRSSQSHASAMFTQSADTLFSPGLPQVHTQRNGTCSCSKCLHVLFTPRVFFFVMLKRKPTLLGHTGRVWDVKTLVTLVKASEGAVYCHCVLRAFL
jgi:hypothetical protein